MGKLCRVVCSDKHELALWCLMILVLPLFFGGISLGSLFIYSYAKDYHISDLHTNTTCSLLNYTFVEHECQRCEESCYAHRCFDEKFFVSYRISNETIVYTTLVVYDASSQHKQAQMGFRYPCFYQRNHVRSVIWDLPDEKVNLVTLCIAFGIAAVLILFIVAVVWYWKMKSRAKVTYVLQGVPRFFGDDSLE
ncbi:unnamed protein product [Rotaria magnacalcarata]|uniref:Uncharacterized protein n=1 Tax=Rotaria magnacalcarata TaxID=392030 RepID=A0A819GBL2_9BILA|nr:unnamed protein product [Rotaria magnacalcarata]CAF2171532.1 unnamed protein product [Rotaria magnacalcarata]CAF3879274.1 unnamed protein product [Rotaria magnacalcarata]CAF3968457.1 unnamed protein product [Rotaria magnacalcarata]